MKKDIGHMIAALRRDRHITQQQLADMIDCTKQTISNYERGTRTPDYNTLASIADALNAKISMFLSEEEQRNELERIFLENMSTFSANYVLAKKPDDIHTMYSIVDSPVDKVDNIDNYMETITVKNDAEPRESEIARIFPLLTKANQELILATAEALLSGQGVNPDSHGSTGSK